MKANFTYSVFAVVTAISFSSPLHAQQTSAAPTSTADTHGWIGTETVKTKFGDFEFKNGYPTAEAANAMLDQLKFNRATEVYLTQIPPVSIAAERGLADFGAKQPNQIVIWETLMDAATILLTSFRRDIQARCRTVTSSSDHRPSSLASEYEASKWTERPTKRWR